MKTVFYSICIGLFLTFTALAGALDEKQELSQYQEESSPIFNQDSNKKTNTSDWYGVALLLAVQYEQPVIVDILLSLGTNPDTQDIYGWTPLMYAASKGQMDIVNRLLSANADPNIKDWRGNTALGLALQNGYLIVAALLYVNT